jgi:predicted membrane protein
MAALGLFSGVHRVNRAERLEGESYTALFGNVEVDFTHQELAAGDHVLSAAALFGSVKLIFPADVDVRMEGAQIFGSSGLHDELEAGGLRAGASARVVVQGTALFGSIEVVRKAAEVPREVRELTVSESDDRPDEGRRVYEGETRKIGPVS